MLEWQGPCASHCCWRDKVQGQLPSSTSGHIHEGNKTLFCEHLDYKKNKSLSLRTACPLFSFSFFFDGGSSGDWTHDIALTKQTLMSLGWTPALSILLSSPLSCTHKQPLVQDWASLIQISRLFNLIWVSSDSQNTPERSRTTLVSAPVWESGQSSPGSNSSSEVTNKLWQRSNQKPLTLEQ